MRSHHNNNSSSSSDDADDDDVDVMAPPSTVGGDDDDDNNFDGWDAGEDDTPPTKCPSCAATMLPHLMLGHWRSEHAFDLLKLKTSLGLDFYGCIRAVNLLRRRADTVPMSELLASRPSDPWITDDSLLAPVLPDDPLLYSIDFDELEDLHADADAEDALPLTVEEKMAGLALRDGSREKMLEMQVAFLESKYTELQNAFAEYKDLVRKRFLQSDGEDPAAIAGEVVVKKEKSRSSGPDGRDEEEWDMDYYFGSYAELGIHDTMLKDSVRTEAYRDAVYMNKDFFKDKVVLDVGCGTGVLSMFAAKAGAKQVFAVDNSTIILRAKKIAAENGLADKITFIQGEIERVSLPVKNVDIIISEWMGYFLLFENMLPSVLSARDRYLLPASHGGVMAPSTCTMHLAATADADWVNEHYHHWNDVYGFQMRTMKDTVLHTSHVDVFPPGTIVTDAARFRTLDLATVTDAELEFTEPFDLLVERDDTIVGLISWFDTFFQFPAKDAHTVEFSTSPFSKPTHWMQTIFILKNSITVEKGWHIKGDIEVTRNKDNKREMIADFKFSVTKTSGDVVTTVSQRFNVR